ncbi:MAG: phosphotransferase [Bacteroidota bacterium]
MHAEVLTAYLEQQLPSLELLGPPESLSGGLLNYVWRVPAKPQSFIAKYTPPYIAAAPQIAMDASRSRFEADALRWWSEQKRIELADTIRPPRLLHAFAERSLILMEDLGDAPNLAAILPQIDHQAALKIGQQLGSFLAQLHATSFQDADLGQRFQNQGVQSVRLAVQYNQLAALQKAKIPQAQELAERIAQVGRWITKPGICLIMGDLWPPSILHTQAGLRIIDWEFTHFGWPVQDVAHLAAHLWMQAHMAKTHEHIVAANNCLFSFLETYFTAFGERSATLEDRKLYFVHVGAEILARTIGTFQAGYLYEGLPQQDIRLRSAVEFATQCILSPKADGVFGPFFVI